MAKQKKVMNVKGFEDLLAKQTGRAVRPYRADGYVNLLNKYGTQQDTTEHYHYREEPVVPDDYLTSYYEGNGLFAKIIDAPAEEAIKHGFSLKIKDDDIENFYTSALDELDWEEQAMTAIKWARLFGGSIIVMLINDGRGLDEPLDWKNIKSIDDIRVYDRSLIQEDTSSMFTYTPNDPFRTRSSRLGMPEYYDVYSMYGNFRVHESRCLVFQNGILPENTTNSVYQMWGMPEYVRINKAIRDAEVAHGSAVKLLDRSIQAVYKMQGLADEVATEEGEDRVLKRLQTIDMARGMLNTITIDADGEDYDFRTFQFSGVSDVIECTCNYLSALTNIPQTILFGRSPAGMNATGTSDLENWYNYVERIQSRMVKKNLRYLLSIVFQAGVACGEVDEVPDINIEFNPLWSLSELEQAQLDQTKAATQQTRAQTAQIYMDAQVIDPSEVRKKLADSDEFDVESMLDEYDNDEDLFANMPQGNDMGGDMGGMGAMMGGMGGMMPQGMPQDAPEGSGSPADYSSEANIEEHNTDPGTVGDAPTAAPAATKLPQDMSTEEIEQAEEVKKNIKKDSANFDAEPASWISTENGNHIPLNSEGTAIGGPLKGEDFSGAKQGSSKSGRSTNDFLPNNSYENDPDYQKALNAWRDSVDKREELSDKYHEIRDELKSEMVMKPRDEWTDDDELNALFGTKPMIYTEKGEELQKEADKAFKEYMKADDDFTKKSEELNSFKDKAHAEEITDYKTSEPAKATKDDYEGFKLTDTGTSFGNEKLKSSDSYIAEMSPKEYLDRCAYEIFDNATIESTMHGVDNDTVKSYSEKMKNGEKFDLPYLNYKDGGQEGRHRAAAAYLAGIDTIPVLIIDYDKDKVASEKGLNKDSRADDVDWVTISGTHTPLEEGKAIGGGKLAGRDFSKAKSQKNTKKAAKRAPVNGKDISASYKGEKNLSSIIKAQGFDGLPRIVNDDEFDAIAAESDFIAQRIYTATTQEILDEYQNQLYNGEFRVDCNGAAYGYGMYCASADGTEVTDRIKQEMLDYKNDNENRLRDAVEKEVTATLTPEDLCNTDAAKQAKLTKKEAAAFLEYQTVDDYDTDLMTPENKKVINNLMKDDNKYNAAYGALYSLTDDKVYSYSYPSTTETLTLDKSAKVASYNEIADEARNAGYYDTSAYAALKGYDAINIERMYGSDYTIVLNRTKCVFKNGAMATDAKDKGKITFEAEKNGRIIKALRNGKVIGYVMVEGSNDKKNNDGGPGNPGSGNHGHAGVPGVQGGSAPQGAADSAASYERITKLKDNFSKLSTDMQTLYIQQTGAIPKNEEAELLQGVENGDENAIKRFKEISDAYFDMAEYSREPKEIGVEMRDWLLTQDEETRANFFNDSMNRQFSPDEREWCNTDSDAQKLAIDLGMSGNTPQVVSEDDFNKFIEESGATPMYRGVKNLDDMSAENIQYQTLYDTEKFYMGSGIYGDGLYFSDDTHTAKGYSNGGSEILTAALRPDAKVIDSNSDELKEAREKLGCFTPIHNAEAALYLGYDAIRVSDMDYTVVLNRSAMIVKDNCDYMAVGALDNI